MPLRTISLEKRGPIASLALRRPEKENAIDRAFPAELAQACEAIEVDDKVRVVLLTAQGDNFCRGWDAAVLAGEDPHGLSAQGDPFASLAELPRPVVCAIQGEALSAGLAEVIAGRIAERGPIAVRYAKEAVRRGLEMPLEQALRYETDLTIILQTTEDRTEGVSAFLEKRKPKFKGQ